MKPLERVLLSRNPVSMKTVWDSLGQHNCCYRTMTNLLGMKYLDAATVGGSVIDVNNEIHISKENGHGHHTVAATVNLPEPGY